MTITIHVAGPMTSLVQRCSRCGVVLADYNGAMVPSSDLGKTLGGWAEGAHIEVQKQEWFSSSHVTELPATCGE